MIIILALQQARTSNNVLLSKLLLNSFKVMQSTEMIFERTAITWEKL